ncbi:MAG: hypothetical protein ACI4S2_17570, partial [Lachnospiraceae bacterium]
NERKNFKTVFLPAMSETAIELSEDCEKIELSFSDDVKKRTIVSYLYRIISALVETLYYLLLLSLSADGGMKQFFGDEENLIDTQIYCSNKKDITENLEIVYKKRKIKDIPFNLGNVKTEHKDLMVRYVPNLKYKKKLHILMISYFLYAMPGTAVMLIFIYLLSKVSIFLSILFLVVFGCVSYYYVKTVVKRVAELNSIVEEFV